MNIERILARNDFSKEDIIRLLFFATGEERTLLFKKVAEVKEKYIGKKVWFRGSDRVFEISAEKIAFTAASGKAIRTF